MTSERTTPTSAAKPLGYYGLERADVVAELPQPIGRALDVGCGEGGVGRSLRAAGATWVSGIEIVPEAASAARAVLDEVYAGSVEAALSDGGVTGPFDTICCYDVLEHLVDPEPVLRSLRELAAPGARLHVSIPNARHFSLLVDLVLRGTFGYAEFGHRDATHLRWYTRRDIVALVGRTGWDVQWAVADTFRGRNRYVDRLTLRRAREFLALQWHVLAHAA
jgi:2-polyprenyl-3-methyl-5-hydroxy-6-metoxy-1,4-benzoquinol methylase